MTDVAGKDTGVKYPEYPTVVVFRAAEGMDMTEDELELVEFELELDANSVVNAPEK